MSDKNKQAVACFAQGFSCAQAVFSTFAPELGMEREQALKASCAFGGGMSRLGLTCGAVSGALMAIGLKYGKVEAGDNAPREKTYQLSKELVRRFEAIHGSVVCNVLISGDIRTDEGRKAAQESGVFDQRCPVYVGSAADILEDLI